MKLCHLQENDGIGEYYVKLNKSNLECQGSYGFYPMWKLERKNKKKDWGQGDLMKIEGRSGEERDQRQGGGEERRERGNTEE